MQASHASITKARLVAVLLTAASPMIGSFGASAQQMANGPDISKCDMIRDHNLRDNCLDASIADSKARIAAAAARIKANEAKIKVDTARTETAKVQITAAAKSVVASETMVAAANAETACNKELVVVAQSPDKQAKGRNILVSAGKDVAQYGACKLLAQLKNE